MHDKRVALVTGANQGIGLQIAKELAAKELTVLVGSRNLARGEEAARTLGGDARALQLDVTDRVSIAAAAKRIREELGRLDVLVNNAAISNTSKLPGMSVADYAKLTRPSNVSLDEVRAIWDGEKSWAHVRFTSSSLRKSSLRPPEMSSFAGKTSRPSRRKERFPLQRSPKCTSKRCPVPRRLRLGSRGRDFPVQPVEILAHEVEFSVLWPRRRARGATVRPRSSSRAPARTAGR